MYKEAEGMSCRGILIITLLKWRAITDEPYFSIYVVLREETGW